MTCTSMIRTCVAAMLIAAAPAVVLGQAGLPTIQELQANLDAGKYQDVLRQVQQLLSSRTLPAGQYDKARLLELRGEAQLQLKQTAPAAQSFADAAEATDDEKAQGQDKAMAQLLKRSPGGNYTPKFPVDGSTPRSGTRQAPISVLDAATRKEAFKAMFNDELKPLTPKLEAASRGNNLPQLLTSMKQVGDLRALEVAGTDKDTQTAALLDTLGTKASDMMTSAMDTMSQTVKEISAKANKTSTDMVTGPTGIQQQISTRAGINSNEAKELQDIVATVQQIVDVCKALPEMTGRGASSPLKPVGTKAEQLLVQAQQVLDADYGTGTANVSNPVTSGRRNNTGVRGNTGARNNVRGN